MYTAILTGSRHYQFPMVVNPILWDIFDVFPDATIKVGDNKSGLDYIVDRWMTEHFKKTQQKTFHANWSKYGNAAGPIRNHKMVDSGGDICIAFPDDDSKGTMDCAKYAYSKNIKVWFPELPSWAQWAAPIATFKGDIKWLSQQ